MSKKLFLQKILLIYGFVFLTLRKFFFVLHKRQNLKLAWVTTMVTWIHIHPFLTAAIDEDVWSGSLFGSSKPGKRTIV